MFSLIKSAIGLAVLLVVAYGVFFVDLGDQPLSGHIADVWRSPVVQEKLEMVRQEATAEIEDRLAEAAEKQTRKTVREHLGHSEEIAEEDRQALNDVIGKATASH